MDEHNFLEKSFDQMDEQDLAAVLNQVSRRMIVLNVGAPDADFWNNVITRVSKLLSAIPHLTPDEKLVLLSGHSNVKINVIRSLRQRTGMRLNACKNIIENWMRLNG